MADSLFRFDPTFYCEPSKKSKIIARVEEQIERGLVGHGRVDDLSTRFKFGAIASIANDENRPYTWVDLDYALPLPLLYLQSAVFNALDEQAAIDWHLKVVNAYPVGVDLGSTVRKILCFFSAETKTTYSGRLARTTRLLHNPNAGYWKFKRGKNPDEITRFVRAFANVKKYGPFVQVDTSSPRFTPDCDVNRIIANVSAELAAEIVLDCLSKRGSQ